MAFCPVHTETKIRYLHPLSETTSIPAPYIRDSSPPPPPPHRFPQRYRRNLTKGLGCVHTTPDSSFCAGAKIRPDTGLLFTHKNRDFSAVSVTERICAALISKVESHIIIGVRTIPHCFSWRREKTSGMLWVSFSFVCGTGQGQN